MKIVAAVLRNPASKAQEEEGRSTWFARAWHSEVSRVVVLGVFVCAAGLLTKRSEDHNRHASVV